MIFDITPASLQTTLHLCETHTMHIPTALLVLGSGLLASAGGSRQYAPASLGLKRDAQSCEQTYGAGFVACGSAGPKGTMCFNPSQGQVREFERPVADCAGFGKI